MTAVRPVGEHVAQLAEPVSPSAEVTSGGLFAVLLALLSRGPTAVGGRQQDASDGHGRPVPVEAPAHSGEEGRKRVPLDAWLLAWALASGLPRETGQRVSQLLAQDTSAVGQHPTEAIEGRGASSSARLDTLPAGMTGTVSGPPPRLGAPVPDLLTQAVTDLAEQAGSSSDLRMVGGPAEPATQLGGRLAGELPETGSTLLQRELPRPASSDVRLPVHSLARAVQAVSRSAGGSAVEQNGALHANPPDQSAPASPHGTGRALGAGLELVVEMSGSSRLASQGQRHPLNEEGAAIRVAGRPHAPEQSGQASHAASGTSGTVTTEVSNREDAERSTPGTRASDPHQVLAQVMQQVHASVRRGLSEVWVRLEPPSLGLVEVRLVAFDGMLRVTLASTDPMVRELLQSGSEELRRDLAVRGFRVERVLVTEPLTTSDWGGNAGTATGQEGGWGQQSSRQPGSGVPARALVQPAVQPQQDPVVVPGKRPRGAPESRIEVWA